MTPRQESIRARIVANDVAVREQLVELIDDDLRSTVVASVAVAAAATALMTLSPALIIAHGISGLETRELRQTAKQHPEVFFMLIVSGLYVPKTDNTALSYVTGSEPEKNK